MKKNLIALILISGSNALIPLFLFPYILLQIGTEKFSALVTFEAIAFVILTISLYSFDIGGLKLINNEIKSIIKISKIYYSIIYARIFLLLLSCMIWLLIIIIILDNQQTVFAAFSWMLFPLGMILQSAYFYQATNNNMPLAIITVITRVSTCIISLVIVKEETSIEEASLLISLTFFTSGVISFLYLGKKLQFISPDRLKKYTRKLLLNGFSLFIGNISVLLYRGSNILLLNLFEATPSLISNYAIAEKYIKMLQAVTFPLTQIFSVNLLKELRAYKEKQNKFFHILWNNTKHQIFLGLTIVIIIILALTQKIIEIKLLSEEAKLIIIVMLPAILFGIFNYMYGAIAYTALNIQKKYAKTIFISGIFSLFISIILIFKYFAFGAAAAYVFSEILLSILLLINLHIYNKKTL